MMKGVYAQKMLFLELDCPLRTDENFRARLRLLLLSIHYYCYQYIITVINTLLLIIIHC